MMSPMGLKPAEARRKMNDFVKVIDVRTDTEWKNGHLPNAVHLPLDKINMKKAEKVLGKPPVGKMLVYCRSGQRARLGAYYLQELGYGPMFFLDGMYHTI